VSHVVGRYFLNIKEGATLIPDPEGADFSDESAVYQEIRATVDDVVRRPHVYGDLDRWTRREFVVTDESGRTVLEVPVVALIRPN
jgi:Domain of unknown function (DUF6894)